MDEWTDYVGKKVFIKLKNDRQYSGKVTEVKEKGGLSIIFILDKFNQRIAFYDTEISVIEEEKGGDRKKG